MALTLSQFIAQYNNKFEAYPGDNAGYQCVDLAQFWSANFGYQRFSGNAVDIYNQPGGNYLQIPNTPTGVPQPGDIVIWGKNAQAGTGAAGHVGIFVSGDVNSLVVFNQNAPEGSPCHNQAWKNYAGVIGWLRPHALIVNPPSPAGGTAQAIRTAYVRSAPNLSSPLAGSGVLQPAQTFQFSSIISGQQVTQNGITSSNWYHSIKGNYVWAGNCKTI
jgi:hypothetical protein